MAKPRPELEDLHRLADALPSEGARMAALRRILAALPEEQRAEAQRILEEIGTDEAELQAARERLWADPTYRDEVEDGLAAHERGDVLDLDDALARFGNS